MSRLQKQQMAEALQPDYSVRQICDVLGLHRSSLYYQAKTDPSEHQLRQEIEQLAAGYPTYGYRRITQLLKRRGYTVGTTRVARLMSEQNLSVAIKRACQTTQSVAGFGQWVNRIENLDICRRNQVWVGDITYVRLKGQFIYVREAVLGTTVMPKDSYAPSKKKRSISMNTTILATPDRGLSSLSYKCITKKDPIQR